MATKRNHDAKRPAFGKGSAFKGKPGRSGAPRGNLNNLTNGTGIDRKRLVVGELPAELLSVRREGRAYRRVLEADVLRAKGEISTVDAHCIDTASAATIHAAICRFLLRKKIKSMTTNDVLATSREITRAKRDRDAAVRAIGLDRDTRNDAIEQLYAMPLAIEDGKEAGDESA